MGIETAIALASLAATVGGTVASAVGQGQSGQAQAQADTVNAQIQDQNAQIAKAQASSQAAIDRQATERRLGEVAASYGAAGVDPNQGSPLDVMADQARTGELTRQLDLYRGTVAATGNTEQADLLRQQADAARSAGDIRAGGTLLAGLGTAARAAQPFFAPKPANAASPQSPTVPEF